MVNPENKQIIRIVVGFLLLALAACPLQAQTTPTAPASDISPDEISDLLEHQTVSQPSIATPPITALPSGTVTREIPSDIVLLLDNSGSMKVNDPQFLTAKAVTEFINQLDYSTRLGIVIFDQKVTLAHPLTEVSEQSRADMLNSLKQINYRGLHTNSPDGLERAIYELKLHAREDTERFIVFLTDGIVDTGDKQKDVAKVDWMRKELAADAAGNNIRIFGIAFTDGADFQLIQSLAQQTNAEYFRAFSADKIAGVFEQIQQRIKQTRQEALQAEIEASKPPPPPVVIEAPKPVEPPKPIIVQVPEQPQGNQLTQYMLFGIAGLLVVVLFIVLIRGRSSGATQAGGAKQKMPEVELVDMRNVTGKQSYPLTTPITQVGRIKGKESPDVTYIVIPEKSISRHHAVIEFRNHAFWVMDQGSGNGTKLNNRLLEDEQRLKHGDILTFDTFNFMFSEPGLEQSDATVLQAPGGQAAPFEDMSVDDEDSTEMLPSGSGKAAAKTSPPPAPAPAPAAESDVDVSDIIEDISNWGLDEKAADDARTPPAATTPEEATIEPAAPAEKPAEKHDPVKEGLVKETEDGFEPAKTMTPAEFDRLFAELNDDEKK